jgi:hypothetical protein
LSLRARRGLNVGVIVCDVVVAIRIRCAARTEFLRKPIFLRQRERLTADRICLFGVDDAGRSVAAASGAIT